MADLTALVDELERSYRETQERMSDPAVYNDHKQAADAGRRLKELERPYQLAQEWRGARADLDAARSDGDLRELVPELESRAAEVEEELKLALVESDPADTKDVIVEMRQGVGGDEAALWAGDVFRMLTRYAERRGFKWEQISASANEGGGVKESVFAVKGDGAYSVFKWEAGTHRVQRVPTTESQGRIHTSTATVAVMPEAEEVEVDIDQGDLKIDVYRSTGPGGQSVNTTDSAVRITHLPRASSSRCRTSARSSRTATRRCACSAPACSSTSASGSRRRSPPRAARRSAAGSGRRRSARTTSPRTGSRTTASSSRSIASTRFSRAISTSSRPR